MAEKYDFRIVEQNVLSYWEKEQVFEKARKKGKKKFYFLDGPPYTSGRVHIGTAWNKALKDMVLRYKRMQGFKVWDRAGYDMHGLPTAQKVMAERGLKTKEDIEKYGVDLFVTECEKFSLEKMEQMNKDFIRLGVWMDFKNAYMPITKEYINGEWWLIKKIHEQGRLYEGFRTMAWDYVYQTSLSKHELEYKNVVDTSIFVKFKVKGTKNEFLIVWTTTPWTIPFNLGIMVNPELEYVKMKVENEIWIMSKGLGPTVVMSVCNKKYELLEEFKGDALEGMEYEHPFADTLGKQYSVLKKDHPKVHSVVLSSEYVDLSAGTGLVHMAPGCGPEDYEVGCRNHIPAWNTLLENGDFPDGMGDFSGRNAKEDNLTFKDDLEKRGVLIAENEVEHEYPFGQRSHAPVIFRATKQWFFKVEDLKDEMVKQNDTLQWVPDAAYNAFNSWLRNLRDNSITKQNYWGTPVPIWRNENDPEDVIVIGSIEELEQLSGKKVAKYHKPWIDDVIIVKNGKTYRRIPDILDVWIDAGTASWNCLDFPKEKKHFDELFPADFILEGKDQIRGWFNLLHITSMLAFRKPSFKSCYMHGFVQDAQGRKMSKSLGNQVSPYEVIDAYGADTLRYYMISGANPGLDINYNFDDMKTKNKNLFVLWNLHAYLLDLIVSHHLSAKEVAAFDPTSFTIQEKYMYSKLHSCIKKATACMDEYRLNELPLIVEECFLELSRTYIQAVREKASVGEPEEKLLVCQMVYHVLLDCLTMFSVVCPFISEEIYLQFRKVFSLKEESIHLTSWPVFSLSYIDTQLEEHYAIAQQVMQAILFAREKINLGVRWPLRQAYVETKQPSIKDSLARMSESICNQTNVKQLKIVDSLPGATLKLVGEFKKLGPLYGKDTPHVITALAEADGKMILDELQKLGKYSLSVKGKSFEIKKDYFTIERVIPKGFVAVEIKDSMLYLDQQLDPELELEGYAREIMRRVQASRKARGLQKTDKISLFIHAEKDLVPGLQKFSTMVKEKCGAHALEITDARFTKDFDMKADEKIKGKSFMIGFDIL